MNSRSFFSVRTVSDDDRGVAMIEYSLIAACIAVLAIGGVSFLGDSAKAPFLHAGQEMTAGAVNPDEEKEEKDKKPW